MKGENLRVKVMDKQFYKVKFMKMLGTFTLYGTWQLNRRIFLPYQMYHNNTVDTSARE